MPLPMLREYGMVTGAVGTTYVEPKFTPVLNAQLWVASWLHHCPPAGPAAMCVLLFFICKVIYL